MSNFTTAKALTMLLCAILLCACSKADEEVANAAGLNPDVLTISSATNPNGTSGDPLSGDDGKENTSTIPEPSAVLLLLACAALFMAYRRKTT